MTAGSGKAVKQLTLRERLAYGVGDFGLNFFWQGAGFYLLYYYTDVLHLPNGVAGTLFAIGGIWDAISDPLVGYIAERTRSRFGHYRPYLLFGAPVLSLAFVLAFAPTLSDDPTGQAVQVLITLLLFRSAYTLVSIPYAALTTRLVADGEERTRLAGVRMYLGFIGGVTVAALGNGLRGTLDDRIAFPLIAILSAVLALAALWLCFANTREASHAAQVGKPAAGFGELSRTLMDNKPLILLFVAIIFVTIATSLTTKTVLYVFDNRFMDSSAGDRVLFIFTGLPLLTIPLWSAVALRMGKARAWLMASLVTALGLAALNLSDTTHIALAWTFYGVTTVGLSAFGLLFWSMLPDTVEYGLHRTGVRNEAVIFGMASSSQKAALAGSVYALGHLLDGIGYDAAIAQQSAATLDGLLAVTTLIPLGAIVLAGLLMVAYPLDSARHRAIIDSLREQAD